MGPRRNEHTKMLTLPNLRFGILRQLTQKKSKRNCMPARVSGIRRLNIKVMALTVHDGALQWLSSAMLNDIKAWTYMRSQSMELLPRCRTCTYNEGHLTTPKGLSSQSRKYFSVLSRYSRCRSNPVHACRNTPGTVISRVRNVAVHSLHAPTAPLQAHEVHGCSQRCM